MAVPRRFPVALPPSGATLAVLCALYLLAGLTGHDPWKSEDAVHFGITYGFLTGSDWLVPHLAGEPVLDLPPLYYWVAAGCARLFGSLLPLHDAARLASGLFGAAFLALLASASRSLHGQEAGSPAALIAIGCLGLLVPIHEMQPMVALLAASAAFYAGLALLPQQPVAGGLRAGLGLGLGFLAAGLTALVTLAPLLLLLPAHPHWRNGASRRGLIIALAAALPLIALWPLLLARLAPEALPAWWAAGGLRFQGNWLMSLPDHAELLAWFAWPALPLALWALWLHRNRLAEPALILPLAGTATTLLALLFVYGPRPLLALPLLVPLVLLATAGAGRLRRGATNAFDWFGMMTFTLIAALIWLGGIAVSFGIPAQVAHNFARLEPGFVAEGGAIAYTIAALLTLAWLWLIFASPRSPWRAATHWAAGVTLVWVLVIALLLPWIDYGKSYRGVALSLEQALLAYSKESPSAGPAGHAECIAGRDLGGGQRASLQYFAGIVTLRADTRAATVCRLLLEQGGAKTRPAPEGWRKLWEGHRPGDRSERLRLYRREPQPDG
jgi:4-amino-4-deoxy-L-arabinose transferase-like glycosyltransferase